MHTAKASERLPQHQQSYAENIVNKIWTFETEPKHERKFDTLKEILMKAGTTNDALNGKRFPCHRILDDTQHGFREGHVAGIVAGSGVGKTTLTLNMFLWFAEHNPLHHHFFFALEQPVLEIASRVKTICRDNTALYDRIHIVSNFEEDGTFKHLSITQIEEYLVDFKEKTGNPVGAVVIDHIGVLEKDTRNGEAEGIIGICKRMKPFAQKLKCFLLMLSQVPREKAGIGDLELDKGAAYGTTFFEAYCDWLICLWQPLKRVYSQGAPTIMAFKFGKIRHKNQKVDAIKEDVLYQLAFDPETELLSELTREQELSLPFFYTAATNARKADKKNDVGTYVSRRTENQSEQSTSIAPTTNTARH